MKTFVSKLSILLLSFLLIVSVAIIPVFAAKNVKEQYPLDEESPLNGLSIGFYGDSICEGMVEMNTEYAAVRAWAGRIAAANGCTFDNYGRSGASVSNCRGANTIMTQLVNSKNAGKQYDIIVLHGSVNDAWDDVAVGEITEDYPPISSYDPSTFAPALEQVLTYTEENFPDATICYIINFKFLNASMGISLMDMDRYVDMTIEICEKWGIEYLDLYHNEELVDALHPYTTGPSGTKHYQNTYLYDFEQNMAGVVRFSVKGTRGTEITVRHGELLVDGKVNFVRSKGFNVVLYRLKAGKTYNLYTAEACTAYSYNRPTIRAICFKLFAMKIFFNFVAFG